MAAMRSVAIQRGAVCCTERSALVVVVTGAGSERCALQTIRIQRDSKGTPTDAAIQYRVT